jgi:hypothetical protein
MTISSVERFYSGKGSGEVTVRERGLSRALEPRPGSSGEEPRSFTWGRNETGATQLSFALLSDALCDDAEARRWHQNFRRRVIANFPERWTITRSRILAHVQMMRYRGGGLGSSGQVATPRLKFGVHPANSD